MAGESTPVVALTGRELDVLRLVALGLSNRDIAEELVVAPETVRWYLKQIYSKLGVSGRIQAVNRARELGLAQSDHPVPLQTVSPSTLHPISSHHLPVPITSFIGRSDELAEVKRLLEAARLLTLTGVGGTGKTRLALRAVEAVIDQFRDGVYFVDLAPLSHHSLVTKAIADAVGVIENSPELASQVDTLKRALVDRELLLVLDNFEHVIEAAPVVSALLATGPRFKVLVTSRETLHLSGEQEYAVPPLSLPPDRSIVDQNLVAFTESEAASLFVQRAQMVLPHFEVTADNAPAIAQICARLDGLPLAIELAASRCKLLSPQAMLTRLSSRLTALTGGSRDAPPRQQTLRRTLDWSYQLLGDGEKTLFARLSVFRGGRSLEAIEAVCGPDLSIDVLDGLTALADKSLIQQKEAADGEPRFVMLETIHEYARERLAESGQQETIRRRYADYFVTLAERAEPELRLANHARWFQRLELELNNLRAVLEWSLGEGDVTLGVRLASALPLFWWASGYHVESRRWIDPLFKRLDEVPETYHAKFLFSAGMMAIMQSDLDTAKRLLLSAVEVSRQGSNPYVTGWAFTYSGFAMVQDMDTARVAAEEGLALFRELDYQPGMAQALNVVGLVAASQGDHERARQAYDECLIIARQTGETRQLCHLFHNLSFLARRQGDYESALDAGRHALGFAQAMHNRNLIALSLAFLAGPLSLTGQPRRAACLLGAADAALERMGAFQQPIDKPELEAILADARTQLGEAAFQVAYAEGRVMTLEQAVASVLGE